MHGDIDGDGIPDPGHTLIAEVMRAKGTEGGWLWISQARAAAPRRLYATPPPPLPRSPPSPPARCFLDARSCRRLVATLRLQNI